MRYAVLSILIAALSACTSSKKKTGDDSGAGVTCGTVDAARCNGAKVETCRANGEWAITTDCAATDRTCSDASGTPACVARSCNRTGFAISVSAAYSDTGVFPDLQQLVLEDRTTTPYAQLYIENYPVTYTGMPPGQTGSVTITGDETTYDTCGVCVLAAPLNIAGQATKVLMAESGSVSFVELSSSPGGTFHVIFTDLVLREVTINSNTYDTNNVIGGERWCVSSLDASVATSPFVCGGTGESFCVDTAGPAAQCATNGTDYAYVSVACGVQTCAEGGYYGAECVDACTAGEANTRRCNADRVQLCQSLTWLTESKCPDTAKVCRYNLSGQGACVDTCTAGQTGTTKCTGNVVATCSGTAWQPTTDCTATSEVCDQDPTSAACVPTTCSTAAATRCLGTMVQTCNGTNWQNTQDCTGTVTPTCDDSGGTAGCI